MSPTYSLRNMFHQVFQEEAQQYTVGSITASPFYHRQFNMWFEVNEAPVRKALWKRILHA